MGKAASKEPLLKRTLNGLLNSEYLYSGLGLLLIMIVSCFLSKSFLSANNLLTILRQASILLMLSCGLTAVVLTGNIDLSVGGNAALTGCLCAQMLLLGIPIWIAIVISLVAGVFIGVLNGVLVGMLRLPPFVATYGTNMVATGLATIVMNGGVIYGLPANFTTIGTGYLGPVPIPIILSAITVAAFYVLLQRTTFGRNIYMIGYNPMAARYSSINTLGMLIAVFGLCGLTGAMGGVMLTARLNAAEAAMSETYGLQIVAAVVMGGTSLLGGEGSIGGTVIGAIVLTVIVNIMNLVGVKSDWQNLAVGAVIILMVWIDVYTRSKRAKRVTA